MDNVFKDVRYGLRSFRKRPGFAIIAVITLALGIGANTAIFTLVNAVLLRSLPVIHPEELVLFSDVTGEGTSIEDSPRTGTWKRFSYSSYQYLREHNQTLQDIAAVRSGETRLSVHGSGANEAAQRASGHLVSGNFFSILGVNAMRGRVLVPQDDMPNAQPAAVVSFKYWQQQLGSDPSVVNKQLVINNTTFTVVGITPPEFFGERVRRSPDFWIALSFQPQIELRDSYLNSTEAYWLMPIGRLKQGVGIGQAQADVNFSLRQFLTQQAGSQLNEKRQKEIQNTSIQLVSGAGGISGLRTLYSKPLRMLMAIVGMILLIACANVGSLLLSRAATRKSEISLRMALGASRIRIIRQLLTESMLLAALGGALGVFISYWGVKLLVSFVASDAPLYTRPDSQVLLFTAGVSMLAGILFGLVPALRASKTDLSSAMKEKNSTGRVRLLLSPSSGMVVLQVALSMVLLTGAGLFARSLSKLQSEDVGFDRSNVLLVGIDPRLAGYKPTELASLYSQLFDRLHAIPNVRSVTMATYSPMSGTGRTSSIQIAGYTPQSGEDFDVEDVLVGPEYIETLGVPLLRGREIDLRDNAASGRVAVVNGSFVSRYFKDQSPIGHTISFDGDDGKPTPIEIVGVIGDVKSSDARVKPRPTVYRPILQLQDESAYSVSIHIRTNTDPSTIAGAARAAINQIDEKLPIFEVTTLDTQLQQKLKQDRLIAQLVGFFGALALLLACIGLYGVMAHGVARRTNEIGIRMALGARGALIARMILRETFALVLIGLLLGIPAALFAAKFAASQLFGLEPSDPLSLIGAALVLTIVALLAGYVPARRASRVNPLVALRYE
ncbi:MAG: permease [Blastocatellia bacterium]|nr:MAG: permease [Blastocatellia bacterium]